MRRILFLIACLFITPSFAQQPKSVDQFSIPGVNNSTVTFPTDSETQFHVLCFLGTECPLARVYGPRLQSIADDFADQGVQFVGINSNVQDSMDDLSDYTSRHGIRFPIGKDFDRSVALQAGATRTPEVIVVDAAATIRYQGRIDDQYQPGIARSKPTVHDLVDALSQLTKGQKVTKPSTTAVGCLIALPKTPVKTNSDVTYCKQVARILQRNCIECHREGEIGPFALQDYDEVVGWGDMMLEVIEQNRMPPWHASPDHGSFANARHMPDDDKAVLKEWVDAGMPYGNAKELPEKATYATGWRLPKQPDLVLDMSRKAFSVPAEGTVEYQYYVVDPKFDEDKWVSAAEIIPGNRAVVHHCIAFIRPPDGQLIANFGMLAAYVPGQASTELPNGYAQKVVAGSRIVFQRHYTPNGTKQTDKTRIGLVFADEKDVTHEVFAAGGLEQEFEIPPGDSQYTVAAKIQSLPKDGQLLSITPHMHLRGKSYKFVVESGKGDETILSVPHYDFNWQHNYVLAEPLDLRNINGLRFHSTFDNSVDNPTNPNPDEYVTWGDQTWQEMAVTFVSIARKRNRQSDVDDADEEDYPFGKVIDGQWVQTPEQIAFQEQHNAKVTEYCKPFVDKYMQQMDKNSDGFITQSEMPDIIRMWYRWQFDRNGDEVFSREEVEQAAFDRFFNEVPR